MLAAACCALAGCSGQPDIDAVYCQPPGSDLVLFAQAVPTASIVPCVQLLPPGWWLGRLEASDKGALLSFGTDRNGTDVMVVRLVETCEVGEAVEVVSEQAGAQRFEQVEQIDPVYVGRRFYLFDGGCVVVEFDVSGPDRGAVTADATAVLGFFSRAEGDALFCFESGGEFSLYPATCEETSGS